MTDKELKLIREYIACPQLGDEHYGEWGILTKKQRFTIYQLLQQIDVYDKTIGHFLAENERKKAEIERFSGVVHDLQDIQRDLRSLCKDQNSEIKRLQKECDEAWEEHSKQIEEYDNAEYRSARYMGERVCRCKQRNKKNIKGLPLRIAKLYGMGRLRKNKLQRVLSYGTGGSMTDNEITKALECCDEGCQEGYCLCECPRSVLNDDWDKCKAKLMQNALALVNRQKAVICGLKTYANQLQDQRDMWMKKAEEQNAEIERLENDLEEMADRLGTLLWHATDGMLSKSNYTTEVMVSALNDYIQKCCEEAEAEAIKEFAERLKGKAYQGGNCFGSENLWVEVADIDNLVKEMEETK